MKIAEVVATFPPYHGGMGYVCFHNSRELALRGHDVTVFTLEHGRLSYEADLKDFKIVRLKTPLIYGDGGMVPQLCSMLKGFDIVHLHYPFFGGAEYVYLSSLLNGRKYFLTYHMDVYGNTLLKRLIMAAYEPLLTKKIIKRADYIGALSIAHLKSSKVAPYVDWNRVVEMPNGVDVKKFCPREKKQGLVREYNLEGKTVVLFVGNLQPFKGLHLLIDSIARIEDRNIVLLVVGGGYSEREYKNQARERGIEERVIFVGPKSPDKDLPDYYNLGDFLVLPSLHSEAFPLVVLEAMASGKPAIVSELPGPSQLVENGKIGLHVKTGDIEDLKNKIEYLAKEKEIRQHMGTEARKKVLEKYNWESIGELLEKTLEDIVGNRY